MEDRAWPYVKANPTKLIALRHGIIRVKITVKFVDGFQKNDIDKIKSSESSTTT